MPEWWRAGDQRSRPGGELCHGAAEPDRPSWRRQGRAEQAGPGHPLLRFGHAAGSTTAKDSEDPACRPTAGPPRLAATPRPWPCWTGWELLQPGDGIGGGLDAGGSRLGFQKRAGSVRRAGLSGRGHAREGDGSADPIGDARSDAGITKLAMRLPDRLKSLVSSGLSLPPAIMSKRSRRSPVTTSLRGRPWHSRS
jgi:hypothetical protein